MGKAPFKHVAIAGNIGAGKTTLAEKLGDHYNWIKQLEDVEGNPYIDDFYADMPRWSFHMQVYYLRMRMEQVREIRDAEKTVIQDRTIYEDANIFAPNLYDMGLMELRDYQTYKDLYRTAKSLIGPPDLLIYLRASLGALVSQIEKRGRKFEDSIRLDYLRKLNERYENWISTYNEGPLLIINVDEVNFDEKPEDFGKVIEQIEGHRIGLFSAHPKK